MVIKQHNTDTSMGQVGWIVLQSDQTGKTISLKYVSINWKEEQPTWLTRSRAHVLQARSIEGTHLNQQDQEDRTDWNRTLPSTRSLGYAKDQEQVIRSTTLNIWETAIVTQRFGQRRGIFHDTHSDRSRPTLSVKSTTVSQGGLLTVYGSGYVPSTTFQLSLEPNGESFATVTTNTAGQISQTINIPSVIQQGSYKLSIDNISVPSVQIQV